MSDTAAAALRDYCADCRDARHERCTDERCACPYKRHPHRDSVALAAGAPGQAGGRSTPRPVRAVAPVANVVWEEPPAPAGKGRHSGATLPAEVVDVLRAHPGRWAKVKTYQSKSGAKSAATSIAKGKRPDLDPEEWEAVGRTVGMGSALYLRSIRRAPGQ